jgi:hypothetical protein
MTDEKEKTSDYPLPKIVKKNVDANRGGTLFAIEPMKLFPDFPDLKRSYYIINDPRITKPRGGHYHKLNHEIMFAVKGAIKLILRKGDVDGRVMLENKPADSTIWAVYVPPGWWHEVRFLTDDAILGVLSSMTYEEIVQNHDDIREIPE